MPCSCSATNQVIPDGQLCECLSCAQGRAAEWNRTAAAGSAAEPARALDLRPASARRKLPRVPSPRKRAKAVFLGPTGYAAWGDDFPVTTNDCGWTLADYAVPLLDPNPCSGASAWLSAVLNCGSTSGGWRETRPSPASWSTPAPIRTSSW